MPSGASRRRWQWRHLSNLGIPLERDFDGLDQLQSRDSVRLKMSKKVQFPGKHSRGAWRRFIQGLTGRPAGEVLRSFDSDRRAKGAMHLVELGATDVPIM